MAIIYSYPTESPLPSDLILGMQASDGKKTVVFTVENLTEAATESIIHNNLPAQFSTIDASGLITGDTFGLHEGSLGAAVTGATQTTGTNNTTIATTSFVQNELGARPFIREAGTSILANDSNNKEVGTPSHSFVFGTSNTTASHNSLVGGIESVAEGNSAFAFGSNVTVATSGVAGVGSTGAFAVGQNTMALGEGAFASGLNSEIGSVFILTSGGTNFTSDDVILTATDTQSAVNPVTIKVKLTINSSGVVTAVEPLTFPSGMTANMPFQVFSSGGGIACQFVSTTAAIKKVGSHGNFAHTFGKNCYSEGQFSLAGGQDVNMIGDYCFSWGNANKVTSSATAGMYHNTVFGYNNTSQPGGENGWGGIYSTVFGRNNNLYDVSLSIVSGEDITATQSEGSLITGDLHNINKSYWSLVSGYDNTVEGSNNAVLGTLNTVTSDNSLTYGNSNTQSGDYSITGGLTNNTAGAYSATFGKDNTNSTNYSIVSGQNNKVTGAVSTILSSQNSFASGSRSAVLNGEKSIASGIGSLAVGSRSIAKGAHSIAMGTNALTGISTETGVGSVGAISLGANTVDLGQGAFNVGTNTSASLTFNLTSGGTGFTVEDDSIRSVTDATGQVTIQVKLDIVANGVVNSLSPVDFPSGIAPNLSFTLSPTGTGTDCQFATGSTILAVGAQNNGAIAMGYDCFSAGQQSFAGGIETSVSGNQSFAYGNSLLIDSSESGGCVMFGANSEITNDAIYATSFGNENQVTGSYSFTHGFDNDTSGVYSAGIGTQNSASGIYSLAYGHSNATGGEYSVGIGENNTSSGEHSVGIGEGNTSSGANSISLGKLNTSSGTMTISIGESNTVSEGSSIAMGTSNTVSGSGTTGGGIAIGTGNNVSGIKGFAGGQDNTVTGMFSTVFGLAHTSAGRWCGAFGAENNLGGDYSTAFGYQNTTGGQACTVGGSSNTATGNYSTAFGYSNEITGTGSFIGGNGNEVVGNYSTSFGFLNEIAGDYSVALGDQNEVSGTGSFASGVSNTVSGDYSHALGNSNIVDTDNNVVVGTAKNTLPLASSLTPRFEVATGGTGGTTTGAQTVSVYATGSGYPLGTGTYSTAVTSGGSGTGLQVEITANVSGAITSAGVVSAGSGYNVGDIIAITNAPQGSGGVLQVTSLGDNSYTSLSVTLPHGTGSGNSVHAASGLVFTALKDSPSYADDTAAATGGVEIGELYHTSGVVKIRLT